MSLLAETKASIIAMAAASRRSRTMIFSAICDSCVALLLLLQVAFAFLVQQLMKRLCVGRICSYTAQRHHALFRLGPFILSSNLITNQPSWKQTDKERQINSGETRNLDINSSDDTLRKIGSAPSLLCESASLSSQGISSSSLMECDLLDHRGSFPLPGITVGTSLIYRRKGIRVGSLKDPYGTPDRSSEINPVSRDVSEEDEASDSVLLNQRSTVGWDCSASAQTGRVPALDMNAVITEDSHDCFVRQGHSCNLVLRLVQALQSEHEKLCRVYTELEEERIAAETAANEAMSMILRLQEQKSALQLEAAHSRRMADEKAFHDGQAIHILEEALSLKENKLRVLEEQIQKMKDASAARCRHGDIAPGGASSCFSSVSQHPPLSESQQKILCSETQQETIIASSEEATCPQIEEEVDNSMEEGSPASVCPIRGMKSMIKEAKSEQEPPSCTEEEKVYVSSILVKLAALEKRLEALSATESKDLSLGTIQHSVAVENDADAESFADAPSFDAECSSGWNGDEEKVVNVDTAMANMSSQTTEQEIDVCEVGECDIPYPITQGKKTSKRHLLLSLSHSASDAAAPQVYEAMTWRMKKVTLEDIDLRLQILENQILLLRQQAIPSNQEHINMTLLIKILQGLDALLLQANRT